MPSIVVLCGNIFDEDSIQRFRGDQFEVSQGFVDMVQASDEAANRDPRIAVVQKQRKRASKS